MAGSFIGREHEHKWVDKFDDLLSIDHPNGYAGVRTPQEADLQKDRHGWEEIKLGPQAHRWDLNPKDPYHPGGDPAHEHVETHIDRVVEGGGVEDVVNDMIAGGSTNV